MKLFPSNLDVFQYNTQEYLKGYKSIYHFQVKNHKYLSDKYLSEGFACKMQNYIYVYIYVYMYGGFPSGANGKESTSASNAGDIRDMSSVPGSGRNSPT